MSVYVGIDVHRKRSQVAVIDQDGQVLANRNVNNGVTPILSVIGGLPPGTPAAFEAAFGWGGCWSMAWVWHATATAAGAALRARQSLDRHPLGAEQRDEHNGEEQHEHRPGAAEKFSHDVHPVTCAGDVLPGRVYTPPRDRRGVGYRRSPGILASRVTRSIGDRRMSLRSMMVVSIQASRRPSRTAWFVIRPQDNRAPGGLVDRRAVQFSTCLGYPVQQPRRDKGDQAV
jgi:hypothetical protein